MPRPSTSTSALLLRRRRQLPSIPVFLRPQSSNQTAFQVIRSYTQATRQKEIKFTKREIESSFRPHPSNVRRGNKRLCSGCGIPLQDKDPKQPGYIYKKKDADRDKAKASKTKLANQVYDRVLQQVDQEMLAKLSNTYIKNEQMKEEEGCQKAMDKKVEADFNLEDIERPSTSPKLELEQDPSSNKPNLCRRCHEITYHSNPLRDTISHLPTPQSITSILTQIQKTNLDPTNPPLLIHVLDVVDFPLSFIPFTPLPNSKVLFVINRADSICERASSMGHVRAYFKRQLPLILKEHGISLEEFDVHPVSAKKGYGIKELRERIFQLRNAQSNVYLIGHTNVGKSSIIAALVEASGYEKKAGQKSPYKLISPTVSVFPHTTVGFVEIPMNAFRHPQGFKTRASLFDTPGVEGDSAYFNGYIDDEYSRAVSLLKVGGFQRPPDSLSPGRTMVLGGLIRVDLLECEGHPSTPIDPHIRITAFSNLPLHITSTEKADLIFQETPSSFWSRKSKIEVITKHAMGPYLLQALELEIKSTGNVERNTVEIVFAGLGFVAIGGNFVKAKLRVWTPGGRGIAVRRPVVERIAGGFSLDVVRKKKVGQLIMLGRKSIGAKIPEQFRDQD